MKTKKATIGATMTWVVATLIILVVVVIFVYASGALAGSEWFENLFKIEKSVGVGKTSSGVDSEQMLLALLKTEVGGEKVEQYVGDSDKFKTNLNKLKTDLGATIKKLPINDEDLEWGVIVFLDNKNTFYIGTRKRSSSPVGLGYVPTFYSDCSLVYLNNVKVSLCKFNK